jgi:putative transposase
MPRRPRELESNTVYHVYNRRNEKRCLFDSDPDYVDFLSLLKKAKQRHPLRLHAYCLMATHWHLALSAEDPEQIVKCLAWLSTKHAIGFRRETATVGHGHVYQGRYCSVAVLTVIEYVRLVRYIEANPVDAALVSRAEDWRWSSLHERCHGGELLDAGPWALPSEWATIVNNKDNDLYAIPEILGQIAAFRPPPVVFA